MLGFILSGIVGSLILTIGMYYLLAISSYIWTTGILILYLLGAILVGSLSGFVGFKLYNRLDSPSSIAEVGFGILSAIMGFCLPIVIFLIYGVIYRLIAY